MKVFFFFYLNAENPFKVEKPLTLYNHFNLSNHDESVKMPQKEALLLQQWSRCQDPNASNVMACWK